MGQELSAVVVLVNDDVDSVHIVPTEQVGYEDLTALRRHVKDDDRIRIQRIEYPSSNGPVQSLADIAQKLAQILGETET